MKKLIALLLTLAMLLSLAACGTSNSGSGSTEAPAASAEKPASADTPTGEPAQELVTLKILCKNDYDSNVKLADWKDYDISQTFIDRLAEMGIAIELETISNADFANVVRTRMASGVDMPDIISVAFDSLSSSEVAEWGMNGLIIPASKLMADYDTDGSIAAYWDKNVPGDRGVQTAPDGNLYWFSYLYNTQQFDSATGKKIATEGLRLASIRKDWVEAVGEEVKTVYTPDELYDLMVKFQENDVNGNGVKDEVVHVKIDSFYDNLARGFGLNTSTLAYVDENGTATSNFYNKDALVPYLEYMNKLYADGFYDTTSFTGDAMANELISENKAAVVFNYATWAYEDQIQDPDALYVPFVLDVTGSLEDGWYAQGDHPCMTFNQYFVTSACKNPEVAAKLFDFIYSDEYAIMCNCVEGVTATVEDDAMKYISVEACPDITADPDGFWAWKHKYSNLSETGVGLYALPNMITIPSYTELTPDTLTGKALAKHEQKLAIMESLDTCDFQAKNTLAIRTPEESELNSTISEALTTYASELLTDIILGNRDISTLDDGIAEMEKLGLKDYIAMVQARYDRAMAAIG